MTTTDQPNTFDQWAIVELLGHRRIAGRVRETQIAGSGFLRLDIPATDGHGEQTQFVSPTSVYALHPVAEDVARAAAAHCRPEPVSRWELTAAPTADPWRSNATPFDRDDDEDLDDVNA